MRIFVYLSVLSLALQAVCGVPQGLIATVKLPPDFRQARLTDCDQWCENPNIKESYMCCEDINPTQPTPEPLRYVAYPGKYWSVEQCPPSSSVSIIDTCRKTCMATDGCTVYQHNTYYGSCVLRNCSEPIQTPSLHNVYWTGYVIDENYNDHPGKYWADSQCPKIEDTPAICEKMCEENKECTAFHGHIGGACESRKCSIPAPQPTGSDSEWEGYVIDTGYIAHPGKNWNREQFPPSSSATVIESCRKTCLAIDGCTVFEHNPKSGGCTLRNCTDPIPVPATYTYPDWTGYVIDKSYIDHPGMTWTDSQCPRIGETPEICQKICAANTECTAFHSRNDGGSCESRKCSNPAPQPAGSSNLWEGYVINTGKINPS